MKKKILLRCGAIAFLCTLIVFIAGIVITYMSSTKMVEQRLMDETDLVVAFIDGREDLPRLSDYAGNDDLRVTVILDTGEVLYESNTTAALENHLDREEVKNAFAGTPKIVTRYSDTMGADMTYYAKSAKFDDSYMVVRIAIKSSTISSYFLQYLPFLIIALVLATAVAAVFADRLSKSVAKRISDIDESLKSLNSGSYVPLKTSESDDEFFAVYNEINELNESTHNHIKQIESEHDKLDAVLYSVSQGIIALDHKNCTVFANRSALSLFGATESAVGRPLMFLIPEKSLCDIVVSHFDEDEATFEYSVADRVYSVSMKRPTAPAIRGKISFIIVFADITAEKDIMRRKSEFFANASHELKTPLTVMQGLAELMLSREDIDEKTKKHTERIHKETSRLSGLIEDMLKLSMLERNERDEVRIPVELSEIAKEVVSELSHKSAQKSLSVNIEGQAQIQADPKRVYELVQNLVANAVNYNKENGVINIKISETEENMTLTVEDSGIGIAKESIPHLCERFYRVDKSRSKKTGGTGLGLAIVKHICALYSASLSIESELDLGTRVTVTFEK